METKSDKIESLLEQAEVYIKINLHLFRLQAIDKSADFVSNVVAKLAIAVAALFVLLFLSVALSLWVGALIGHTYLGFLCVAGFYILIVLLLFISRGKILKAPVNNFIITQMLNKNDKDENIIAK